MTRTIKHRIWSVLQQTLTIALMMFSGLIVAVLASMSAPENYTDPTMQEVSDLGAMRAALALLLLLFIPWYRKIPLVLIIIGGFYAVIVHGAPFVLAIGLTVWIVRAQQRWQWIIAFGGLVAILLNMGWHIFGVQRQG
ncbi:MAG: hypothetical protein L0K07_09835, partial [Yaniella sp.]|nr:hypothetical protein [Yaniella sp.]